MNYKLLFLFVFTVHCTFTMHNILKTLGKYIFKVGSQITKISEQSTHFEELPVELLYIIFNNFFPQKNGNPKEITSKYELLSILTNLSHCARVNSYFYKIMNSEGFLEATKQSFKAITSSYVFFEGIESIEGNENTPYEVLPVMQNHLKAIAQNLREHKVCSHYTILKSSENNKRATELVKELIDRGLSPDFYNGYLTFLHTAAINNNDELIEFLIIDQNAKTTLFSKSHLCKTPLEFAFFYGRFEAVMMLLKKYKILKKISPIEIHRQSTHFNIHCMFFKLPNITPIIKILVKKGLDPNHIISQEISPGYLQQPLLSFAIKHKDSNLVRFLLKKGANPQLRYKKHPSFEPEPIITPLIFAQIKHRDEIARLLQEA